MIPLVSQNSYNIDVIGTLMRLFFELASICMLMWTFRPRQWPEYFNLNIYDAPLLGLAGLASLADEDRVLPNVVVPMHFAKLVDYKQLKS